jgi:Subtilisin inhibitor-like
MRGVQGGLGETGAMPPGCRGPFRQALLVAAVMAGALVATASALAGATAETSLRITYWDDSAKPSASVIWTLRCNPARGTLARPVVACKRLADGGPKLFAPLRKDVACTQIYGGPQQARIVGTVAGTRIWATFTRSDGCQIARWSRISPWLVPPGGVT